MRLRRVRSYPSNVRTNYDHPHSNSNYLNLYSSGYNLRTLPLPTIRLHEPTLRLRLDFLHADVYSSSDCLMHLGLCRVRTYTWSTFP